MNSTKRIIIRKGDIFCVEISSQYKMFFQYVDRDLSQLNGTVVMVFCTKYPIDQNVPIDLIVNDKVWFYSNVMIRHGLIERLWYKYGKSSNLGDVNNIYFRLYRDSAVNLQPQLISHNWYVWKINGGHQFIGDLIEPYTNYNMGYLYPTNSLYTKIVTGVYPGIVNQVT